MSWLISTLSKFANNLIRIVSVFWPNQNKDLNMEDEETFPLTVKLVPKNLYLNLQVSRQWSVRQLKDKIVESLQETSTVQSVSLTSADVSVIFAGKKLSDSIILDNCGFGEHSVVHIISVASKSGKLNGESKPGDLIVTSNFVSSQNEDDPTKSYKIQRNHFFVFCDQCKDIRPGKCRVRCFKCKEGSLVLAKDPSQWDDVLVPGTINGTCHSPNCDGSKAEFYFKCASDTHPNSTFSSIVLPIIRYNSRQASCLACTDVCSIVLVFPCVDGHTICLMCFNNYCLSLLNEKRFILDNEFGYTISCPIRCPRSSIRETHIFQILGPNNYERYKTFGAEEYLLASNGFFCPQIGCGAGIMVEMKIPVESNVITCHFCNSWICLKCKSLFHQGNCRDTYKPSNSSQDSNQPPLGQIAQDHDRSRWDNEESLRTIAMISKPCPKCGVPTERSDGCMHMICKCNYDWCWICHSGWTTDCMADHWFD
ncbi:E3 ubiquitin-protein ligase parkin [Tetranychus urticae]|uniref:E3 ubiquitin-protein ligase parkin n=1 Tax=Tetranychus urticae TaxID=32264 RepID=T1KBN8_TETUR|nr:E3 ubiquitin-protein ligase parkin [Tetranychus urticae]